jgi:hypothetical protein
MGDASGDFVADPALLRARAAGKARKTGDFE